MSHFTPLPYWTGSFGCMTIPHSPLIVESSSLIWKIRMALSSRIHPKMGVKSAAANTRYSGAGISAVKVLKIHLIHTIGGEFSVATGMGCSFCQYVHTSARGSQLIVGACIFWLTFRTRMSKMSLLRLANIKTGNDSCTPLNSQRVFQNSTWCAWHRSIVKYYSVLHSWEESPVMALMSIRGWSIDTLASQETGRRTDQRIQKLWKWLWWQDDRVRIGPAIPAWLGKDRFFLVTECW